MTPRTLHRQQTEATPCLPVKEAYVLVQGLGHLGTHGGALREWRPVDALAALSPSPHLRPASLQLTTILENGAYTLVFTVATRGHHNTV